MRILWGCVVCCWYGAIFLGRAVVAIIAGRPARLPGFAGEYLARGCESLGGAFLKVGQILGTRVDLLPPDAVVALSRLRDDVRPEPFCRLDSVLRTLWESTGVEPVLKIDPVPLASGTIAQVHIGTVSATGKQFAIKVRRPGVGRLLAADVCYIRLFTKVVAHLCWFRRFPISEATGEVCTALQHQVDFAMEVRMLERFRELFADNPNVTIPEVVASRCTADLIVMEYLDRYRPIPSFRDQPERARLAVRTGLRALYKMIFSAGLIHCDLHASNILFNGEGRVALLDFGFVSEMTPNARHDFAEFFLSIACRDGRTAARIVLKTALRVADDLDPIGFERDMQTLIDKTAGRKAADFQVAGFVFELFQVQRRHGIYGSPSFTLPILSLLTYEGLIKDIDPEIEFQQEAVPFVMEALASDTTANAPFRLSVGRSGSEMVSRN